MSSMSKLRKSRDKWSQKAVERGQKARYQRKENTRIKKERDIYKAQAREAMKLLKEERKKNSAPINSKEELVYISLLLFIVARISFRAVTKVLTVLSSHLGIKKVPCTQTIINWVTRLAIAKMSNPGCLNSFPIDNSGTSNGFFWIIDISIGLGSGKILTVLALNSRHHELNNTAPKLQHVHCVAVAVAESWTGETIADFLEKIIKKTGKPIGYLKDGGRDLAKGVRLLGERGLPGISIDDISHVIANLFKKEYQKHLMFDTFISACGKASKSLKQSVLACLAPPKVSTKARFMNLQRLINWAAKLLKHSPKGRVTKDSVLSKLRASMHELPKCKAFINRFVRDARVLLKCQKILKTEGLNQITFNQCTQLLEGMPSRSGIRKGFSNWLDQHLILASNLGLKDAGMPSASDILESLFGIAKQHGTGNIKDANRIALRIPALCGTLTRNDAKRVLRISVKCQQEVEANLKSLTRQRRNILPNPGSINDGITGAIQNLELITKSGKREKTTKKGDISESYGNCIGPSLSLKNRMPLISQHSFHKVLSE